MSKRMTLKGLRITAGLKQEEVAAELNVTQSAVSNWERGTQKPLAKYYDLLCDMYCCSARQLSAAIINSAQKDDN